MNCLLGFITMVLRSFFHDFTKVPNRNYLDNLDSSA
jgi:hypothetical protein